MYGKARKKLQRNLTGEKTRNFLGKSRIFAAVIPTFLARASRFVFFLYALNHLIMASFLVSRASSRSTNQVLPQLHTLSSTLVVMVLTALFTMSVFAQSSAKPAPKRFSTTSEKTKGKSQEGKQQEKAAQIPDAKPLSSTSPTLTQTASTSASASTEQPQSAIRPMLPDTAAVVKIRILTTAGAIEADLFRRAAPGTVENFLHYVIGGYYTGGFFHRTVKKDNQPDKPDSIKIEVIQSTIGSLYDRYAMPPIELETTKETGIKHLDGTLSMARDEPNSAQYEFFICIGDQPQLDFGGHRNPDRQGFAAFGRVSKGMDIVRKIHQSRAAGQALTPPIMIISIARKS